MAHDRCSRCGGSAYKVCSGCYDAMVLQNDAMRRALTDVMQFSTDERSKAVAKGILDAHGGPDPECVVKREVPQQKCAVCGYEAHSGRCGEQGGSGPEDGYA